MKKLLFLLPLLIPSLCLGQAIARPATTLELSEVVTEANEFDAALSTDDTYSGKIITGLVAAGTIAQWAPVYITSAGKYAAADANGSGTYPVVGLATAAGSADVALIVLVQGTFRDDGQTFSTLGAPLYLSTNVGTITQTAPSTSGDKVQVLGRAVAAHIGYINCTGEFLTVQ